MFYHVCLSCNAKFFTPNDEQDCPRCGTGSTSNDQQIPPGRTFKGRRSLSSSIKSRCNASIAEAPAEATNPNAHPCGGLFLCASKEDPRLKFFL